jgi:two-component system, chemotaxis family, sensor kinase Cph1
LTDRAVSVTLDNCDREPIHIPGSIQPSGALLAFDAGGTLMAWSENVQSLLRVAPASGMRVTDLELERPARQVLQECSTQMGDGNAPYVATEIGLAGNEFDLVVHAYRSRMIAEFEQRPPQAEESAAFALKAHRAIDRIKRHRSIEELLDNAVQDVRALTGFDRVMAYWFRHDDSGDIVAEARRDDLEALRGRRYPASDIPAQARRLYVLNTLRLISDVNYEPVNLAGWLDEPLDLSYSVLRSVSPIHIEYLQNMGVGASMSVSIIVEGRLWGMFACHHMSARRVPFAVRMACDVLAQVIAANVQAIEGRARAQRVESAASARTLLVESLLEEDDVLRSIEAHAGPLLRSLGGEALVTSQFGKLLTFGEIHSDVARTIVESLHSETLPLVQRGRRADWPEPLQTAIGPWVGMLALRFDVATQGVLLALRREQVETVRWGGNPEKAIRVGPLGPRLTPRGSFTEWQETVRGLCEPWDETTLSIARALFGEMQRASNARHVEVERARSQLFAMLGHDLRDPLQSITMAATVIGRQAAPQEPLTQRIKASSNRMQRLIGIVLDVSRIESGLGLNLSLAPVDLSRVITDIVDESRTAHPGTDYRTELPASLPVQADRDRLGQLVSNLVSNARHHGAINRPIVVRAQARGSQAVIEVLNEGERIEPAVEATLFNPYKARRLNERNPTGMGLGLHIAHAIAIGHKGSLAYRYDAPWVIFAAEIPLPAGQSAVSP